MRKPKDYILLFARGLCMGAVEILHGVSAGTMAIFLGVYQEMIQSITEIDREAFKSLLKAEFSEFWSKINGNFLLTLFGGIAVGLSSLLWLMVYLYQHYYIPTSSFFFSLFVLAALLMIRKIRRWSITAFFWFILGVTFAFILTILPPANSAENPFMTFLSGILAIYSLVIPGVSGAFILILIGKYQFIITSFNELNLGVISIFIAGCLFGLFYAARIIQWLLVHYHHATVALLAGLMIGSLNKVWPWRVVLEYAVNRRGDQIPAYDKSVWPWDYMILTGKDPQIFQGVLMMALGVFIVVLIEKIAVRLKTKI